MRDIGNNQNNQSFTINDDGSVTRNNNSGNSNNNSSNGGCIWFIIIAVVVGIIIAIVSSNSSGDGSKDDSDVADSIATEVVEDSVAIEISDDNSSSASYLSVSDDDIYMNASGGETDITVSTDGEWRISTDTESWGHISCSNSSISLTLDRNSSSNTRTDYFVITSGNYSKRVSITQYGSTAPTASIDNVWVDHNVSYNGFKGMKIHVKFDVSNMNGKMVCVYAYFYYGDNTTPLHDSYGNNLKFYSTGTPNYDNSTFSDFMIFVPYSGLNMGSGTGTIDLSFDVLVTDGNGEQLDRHNNTSFQLTQ